jgi:hypothetical protein
MTEKREIQGDNDLRLSSIARIVQISRLASGVNPLKSSKNSSITQQRGPQRARPGRTPSTGRRSGGDVQGLGGVAQRHSGEEPHFHQFGSDGELVRQSVEGVVELEEVVVAGGGEAGNPIEASLCTKQCRMPLSFAFPVSFSNWYRFWYRADRYRNENAISFHRLLPKPLQSKDLSGEGGIRTHGTV